MVFRGGVGLKVLKGGSNQNIRGGQTKWLQYYDFWERGVKPNDYGWLPWGEGGPNKLEKLLRNTWTAPYFACLNHFVDYEFAHNSIGTLSLRNFS